MTEATEKVLNTDAEGAIEARAAVLMESGQDFQLKDILIAAPGPEEVRVQIKGVGICHTDVVCRDGFPVPTPIVLGHEGAGIVEAVGENVDEVQVGDHVILSFNYCGHCINCVDDDVAHCLDFVELNFGGVPRASGQFPLSADGKPVHGNFFGQSSFGTYALAHQQNVVSVPKDMPIEMLGPLGCGVQTGAGAIINSLGITEGKSVTIFGGGAVGLSAVMAAKAIGASQVILVEPNSERRELGSRLGSTRTLDPGNLSDEHLEAAIRDAAGGAVNFVLDTTGIPALLGVGSKLLVPGGALGVLGVSPPEADLPIKVMDVLMSGISIKGILEGDSNPKQFIPYLLGLHREGHFPFDELIQTFQFDDINAAMAASEDGNVVKSVLLT